MKNKLWMGVAIFFVLTACFACAHVAALHAPDQPYRAWVFCIDTSLSPREDQFRRLLAVTEDIVTRDVSYNDLVWLISIQSSSGPAELFVMPTGSSRRSARTATAKGLAEAKTGLIAAIHKKLQAAGTTDLRSPEEAALAILRSHPGATRRILVIGSDFVMDQGAGKISIDPPAISRVDSAAGIEALLLVTYPKPKYLQKMKLSPEALLEGIESRWTAYFRKTGATGVKVRLVDAWPVNSGMTGSSTGNLIFFHRVTGAVEGFVSPSQRWVLDRGRISLSRAPNVLSRNAELQWQD